MVFDDQRLLTRLRIGDKTAYSEVAERFRKEIWAYAYRLCGDRELASDICQETATAVWRAAPEFVGVRALRAWIYRVAHNTYVDHCRKSRLRLGPLDEARLEHGGAKHDVADALVAKDALERALGRLPEEQREAIILTKVQGLTCADAAEVVGSPVGTVKWRVSEGLKTLRNTMSEE